MVDPDGAEDDLPEPIRLAASKNRLVSDDERSLWAGSFVGYPVAFTQPDGLEMDTWVYGIVTGYSMSGTEAMLQLRYAEAVRKLALQLPLNVVKVEGIDYALQTECGASSATLNASELLTKLEGLRTLCVKSRSGVPAKVSNGLTVPLRTDFARPCESPRYVGCRVCTASAHL
ncbi:hypothetical protein PI125_g14790 [Phytophthora idaei]|nr:hypothetical protein PI125_g14790 [Phytophthora idaei]